MGTSEAYNIKPLHKYETYVPKSRKQSEDKVNQF